MLPSLHKMQGLTDDDTGQIRIPFKYAAAHSFEQECARAVSYTHLKYYYQ